MVKLNEVVPQGLERSSTQHLLQRSELSLLDAPFRHLHPWGIWLGGDQMAVRVAALLGKLAQG